MTSVSEDLVEELETRPLGHVLTKPKDITPSIAFRREAYREKGSVGSTICCKPDRQGQISTTFSETDVNQRDKQDKISATFSETDVNQRDKTRSVPLLVKLT